MTQPTQSYIIWFSQRVGSTLLTQALEDTGIAGRPREWLNGASVADVLARFGATNALELRDALWREAATEKRVIGVKYGMREALHTELTALFARVVPGAVDPDGRKAWDAFFPNCRHVFMTRRNKLRLAVSWWRAIQSTEWHRPNRSDPPTILDRSEAARPVAPAEYRYDAIERLLVEACLREAAMQDLFDRWGVVPYTIVYEDFIARYESTVLGVLDFLQIPGRHEIPIPRPAFDRLADEISEDWLQRFRAEWAAKS